MFALLHGCTRHVRWVGAEEEVLMHVGEPSFWFGEYPLLSGQPSVGSVMADTDSRLLFMPAAEFERIVEAEPRHLRPFAALKAERFGLLYRSLAQAYGLAPDELLCRRLKAAVELNRAGEPASGPADVTLSQTALANMVGVSRQTLKCLLRRLPVFALDRPDLLPTSTSRSSGRACRSAVCSRIRKLLPRMFTRWH